MLSTPLSTLEAQKRLRGKEPQDELKKRVCLCSNFCCESYFLVWTFNCLLK